MPKRKSLPTMILISSLRVHKTMDKTFYISVVVDVHFVLSKAEVTVSYALERKKTPIYKRTICQNNCADDCRSHRKRIRDQINWIRGHVFFCFKKYVLRILLQKKTIFLIILCFMQNAV